MTRARWIGFAVLLGLPLSQLGHALATALRVVPEASAGHTYAPGLLLVAALLVSLPAAVAVALLLAAGGRARHRPVVSVLEIGTTLLAVQLLAFLLQEAMEASAAHALVPGSLVAFGLAGQLPITLLAAIALAWLAARLAPAIEAIRDPIDAASACPAVSIVLQSSTPARIPVAATRRRRRSRGPPLLFLAPD